MNEITITNRDGRLTVSSLQVAKDFEKRHDNIIRNIENLITEISKKNVTNFTSEFSAVVSQTSPQNWGDPILTETSPQNYVNLFIESVYADSYGRYQKCYELTREGFSLLVMGFTGKKALEWKLKYIEAFNLMEQELTNRTANIEEVMVRAVTLSVTETVKALIPLIKPSAPKAEGEQKRIIKKNRRTMPSKISTLAPELKQKVDDMIVSGDYSCQQIANFIMNNSDISISQMAVNKYKRRNFIYEE